MKCFWLGIVYLESSVFVSASAQNPIFIDISCNGSYYLHEFLLYGVLQGGACSNI